MNYSNSDKEGLRIGRNCQLVVCSIENLEKFLGKEIYDQIQKARSERENFLTKVTPLSKVIGTLFEHGWARGRSAEPEAYLGKSTEKDIGARRERIPSDKSFDWNTFLREQCGFSDEEVSYCLPKIKEVPSDMLADITLDILQELGIDKFILRLKIRTAINAYLSKRAHN